MTTTKERFAIKLWQRTIKKKQLQVAAGSKGPEAAHIMREYLRRKSSTS